MAVCEECGKRLARGSRARFCSDACRKRAARARVGSSAGVVDGAGSALVDAVVRAVDGAGLRGTVEGELALDLARALGETRGVGKAQLASQFREAFQVVADSVRESDPVDELRVMRDAKRSRLAS